MGGANAFSVSENSRAALCSLTEGALFWEARHFLVATRLPCPQLPMEEICSILRAQQQRVSNGVNDVGPTVDDVRRDPMHSRAISSLREEGDDS